MTSLIQTDSLIALTDRLCRIPSYWQPAPVGTRPRHCEEEVAHFIADHLRQYPWLEVQVDEVSIGRPNVIALDCPPEDVQLLIAGHIDTVLPAQGWTEERFSIRDGRYYALGAADTKAAIAAALDALGQTAPTRGVGYLFYADEEYNFTGMKHFIDHHPRIQPSHSLSLCGASARVMAACRGLIELEFCLTGRNGHASRPWEGRSVTRALTHILDTLHRWCESHDQPAQTVCNVAAIKAGSRGPGWKPGPGVPEILPTANRIPDVAWVLLEVRAGSAHVHANAIRAMLEDSIQELNRGQAHPIALASFNVHLDMPGYHSDPEAMGLLVEPFADLHQGDWALPHETGYLDLALLSVRDGSACLCMGPDKGGAHAPNEWVDITSLRTYRDGLIRLLERFSQ